jgi:tetratricopeptide (TPR) repeat protein
MNKCSTDDEWERLCFMLGDTYIMDKKYGPAIELYESMADGMDNRRELVWNAIYRMGILREMKCDDHHRIVASYQRAIDTRPYRIEPYLALSEYLKESDPEKAIDLATKAQAIQPPPDTFNVDVSVYSEEYKSKFLAHIKEKK